MLEARNAQDARIEDAAAAALVAWQEREDALQRADRAEQAAAVALQRLSREKVLLRDMTALTGIAEPVCARLVKVRLDKASGDGGGRSNGAGGAHGAAG